MHTLFKKYYIRCLAIGLYSIFFATQIFSVTTNTGTHSPSFTFHTYLASAIKDIKAGTVLHKSTAGFTVKKTGGFRLNKRFQPSQFEFLCSPELPELKAPVQSGTKHTYFSEKPLTTIFLFNECRRGPPEAVRISTFCG